MILRLCLALAVVVAVVYSEVYVKEQFDDGDGWKQRWVQSKHKSDYGEFKLTHGKFYGDAEADKGIQTSQDAKFYESARKMDKTFNNDGKTLVLQFSVKHEQTIDCGGGYIKILPDKTDLANFNGDFPYYVMFGPDICGYGTKKVHVIFGYKGKNLLIKKEIRCKDDEFTHVYTLILRPDNTFEVLIDNEKVESGDLESNWDFLAPKKIKDPDAKKPEDWDDEMDGEWEPPQINNPKYKGEWKPRQIKNPNYKGVWVHPEIDNPEYDADPNLYRFTDMGVVGFDLWQVKSGTIFDNILVTDDVDYAKKFAEDTWGKNKDAEKKMKESLDEEDKKKKEEEEKKHKEEDDAKKDKEEEKDEKDEDDEDKEDKKDKDEL